jgi:hypothetical protein
MQGDAFVSGFAVQLVPTWAVVLILAVVLLGAWKLGKMIWTALAD